MSRRMAQHTGLERAQERAHRGEREREQRRDLRISAKCPGLPHMPWMRTSRCTGPDAVPVVALVLGWVHYEGVGESESWCWAHGRWRSSHDASGWHQHLRVSICTVSNFALATHQPLSPCALLRTSQNIPQLRNTRLVHAWHAGQLRIQEVHFSLCSANMYT